MIDIHVPEPDGGVTDIPQLQKYLTDGLDSVVLETTVSDVYPRHLHMRVAGNQRDLATTVDRAQKIGGVYD